MRARSLGRRRASRRERERERAREVGAHDARADGRVARDDVGPRMAEPVAGAGLREFLELLDSFASERELRGCDAALAGYASQFAAWLERQVRLSPYDWFNFYPFWDQVTHDARNE